jgi:hypothetical protein
MTGRDAIWLVCGFIVVIAMVNTPERGLTKEAQLYCEMVQTYKDTQGQYGWPDYRGEFRKVCK